MFSRPVPICGKKTSFLDEHVGFRSAFVTNVAPQNMQVGLVTVNCIVYYPFGPGSWNFMDILALS